MSFRLVYEDQGVGLQAWLQWGERRPEGPTIVAVHDIPPDVAYRVAGVVLVDDNGPYACVSGQEAEFVSARQNRQNRRTLELLKEEFPPPEKWPEILSIEVKYHVEPPKELRKRRPGRRTRPADGTPVDLDAIASRIMDMPQHSAVVAELEKLLGES